jgi:hypothetical protein
MFIHVWRYSPFWALGSLKSRLNSSLSPACLFHLRIRRVFNATLWTTSSHLVLDFTADLVVKFPFNVSSVSALGTRILRNKNYHSDHTTDDLEFYCNKYFVIFERSRKQQHFTLIFQGLCTTLDDDRFRWKHVALKEIITSCVRRNSVYLCE